MSYSSSFSLPPFTILAFLGLVIARAQAATITVTTNDTFSKIESATASDIVLIAPGTYAFRVYLTRQATPANPITIRALDPTRPPIWDFGNTLVENAPGSYTAGDRGRGGWQFSGAHNYKICGIVFRHCRTGSFNSAGIRYYNGTTNLYLKDCVFDQNDNGLTGGTQNSQATVEFCEFVANGNTNASSSSPTHNIYVYGGYLALRYCFVHDSVQAQNFHIRCRDSVLEYNWFARAKNYEGDLMTDDDFSGAGNFLQTMLLRGNVFVQNRFPGNHSQVVALYNDGALANLTLSLRMLYNTFVGANTNAALVHVSNADGTRMTAEISGNIIYGTKTPVLIEDPSAANVRGVNNWIQTNATAGPLTSSVRSTSPGFRDMASQDYGLTNGSICIGAASDGVFGLPGKEYFQNEITNRLWRIRNAAQDLGAFESTSTNTPIGPYASSPLPELAIAKSEKNVVLTWPLFAQDFLLYQSDFSFPVTWRIASYTPSTNLAGLSVTVPTSALGTYFRLQK